MKTVLIVDDEKLFLESLTEGLVSYSNDFQVITANNGKQAVEVINSRAVDLIVTDLKMPVMDGFQLLVYLMNEHFNLPVIVMTAFGTPEIEGKLTDLQAFSYLEKPIDFQRLADKISDGLNQTEKGQLSGVDLLSFLHLLQMEQKTCLLRVKKNGHEGALFFSKGELFDATNGKSKGEEAALEIVGWDDAEIEIINIFKKIKQRITKPLTSILAEATEIRNEAAPLIEPDDILILSEVQPELLAADAISPEPDLLDAEQIAPVPAQPPSSAAKADVEPNQITSKEESRSTMANNVNQSLDELMELEGAKAVALVDSDSGMALGTVGGSGMNLEVAAAGTSEVVKAKYKTMTALGVKDRIEDILISLGEQFHLIRPLKAHNTLFFYVVLNRANANLAMARFKLSDVESRVQV